MRTNKSTRGNSYATAAHAKPDREKSLGMVPAALFSCCCLASGAGLAMGMLSLYRPAADQNAVVVEQRRIDRERTWDVEIREIPRLDHLSGQDLSWRPSDDKADEEPPEEEAQGDETDDDGE